MPVQRLPTVVVTKRQRKWIEKQRRLHNKSYATIMRELIQEKIDKGE